MIKKLIAVAGLVGLVSMGGCRRYDVPEFVEIAANETAFAIPMDGETGDQKGFQSESYLHNKMVATKRIQIPHRWVSTGRSWLTGEYQDLIRVIKVNRAPETRYWTSDSNQGFEVETNDSVTLVMDITCTGMVEETNTATFLYRYPVGEVKSVMDNEVRAKIQTALTQAVGKVSLETLKTTRATIIESVRTEVVQFFAERGLTITNLGSSGGINYRNPKIQEAIDRTVQDQQKVISAEALLQAQLKDNETVLAKARADAEAAKIKAQGERDAISLMGDNYVLLRSLEVQRITSEKWNGQLPMTVFGGNTQVPNLLFNVDKK